MLNEHQPVVWITRQVFALNEAFDALFNQQRAGDEAVVQLIAHFADQFGMPKSAPSLHNAHNCRFDLMLAIFVDARTLGCTLERHAAVDVALGDHLCDTHAVKLGREGAVEREYVIGCCERFK